MTSPTLWLEIGWARAGAARSATAEAEAKISFLMRLSACLEEGVARDGLGHRVAKGSRLPRPAPGGRNGGAPEHDGLTGRAAEARPSSVCEPRGMSGDTSRQKPHKILRPAEAMAALYK